MAASVRPRRSRIDTCFFRLGSISMSVAASCGLPHSNACSAMADQDGARALAEVAVPGRRSGRCRRGPFLSLLVSPLRSLFFSHLAPAPRNSRSSSSSSVDTGADEIFRLAQASSTRSRPCSYSRSMDSQIRSASRKRPVRQRRSTTARRPSAPYCTSDSGMPTSGSNTAFMMRSDLARPSKSR